MVYIMLEAGLAAEIMVAMSSYEDVPDPSWVDLDGELMPGGKASISVFNHGFLFGDSVYEVMRTYGGRPSLVEEHLERLERSARKLALRIPIGRAEIGRRMDRLLERAGFEESYIRVVVTRGVGLPNIDPELAGRPQVLFIAIPLSPPPPEMYEKGVDVVLVAIRRTSPRSSNPDIKSGNYLNSIQAVMEAHQRNAFEGIMLNHEGNLTEASSSNVFLVSKGTLLTPALASGILQGITRRHVLQLAESHGIPTHERVIKPEELLDADEAFISSTIKEILPIAHVDSKQIPCCPGPLTMRLLSLYREEVAGGD